MIDFNYSKLFDEKIKELKLRDIKNSGYYDQLALFLNEVIDKINSSTKKMRNSDAYLKQLLISSEAQTNQKKILSHKAFSASITKINEIFLENQNDLKKSLISFNKSYNESKQKYNIESSNLYNTLLKIEDEKKKELDIYKTNLEQKKRDIKDFYFKKELHTKNHYSQKQQYLLKIYSLKLDILNKDILKIETKTNLLLNEIPRKRATFINSIDKKIIEVKKWFNDLSIAHNNTINHEKQLLQRKNELNQEKYNHELAQLDENKNFITEKFNTNIQNITNLYTEKLKTLNEQFDIQKMAFLDSQKQLLNNHLESRNHSLLKDLEEKNLKNILNWRLDNDLTNHDKRFETQKLDLEYKYDMKSFAINLNKYQASLKLDNKIDEENYLIKLTPLESTLNIALKSRESHLKIFELEKNNRNLRTNTEAFLASHLLRLKQNDFYYQKELLSLRYKRLSNKIRLKLLLELEIISNERNREYQLLEDQISLKKKDLESQISSHEDLYKANINSLNYQQILQKNQYEREISNTKNETFLEDLTTSLKQNINKLKQESYLVSHDLAHIALRENSLLKSREELFFSIYDIATSFLSYIAYQVKNINILLTKGSPLVFIKNMIAFYYDTSVLILKSVITVFDDAFRLLEELKIDLNDQEIVNRMYTQISSLNLFIVSSYKTDILKKIKLAESIITTKTGAQNEIVQSDDSFFSSFSLGKILHPLSEDKRFIKNEIQKKTILMSLLKPLDIANFNRKLKNKYLTLINKVTLNKNYYTSFYLNEIRSFLEQSMTSLDSLYNVSGTDLAGLKIKVSSAKTILEEQLLKINKIKSNFLEYTTNEKNKVQDYHLKIKSYLQSYTTDITSFLNKVALKISDSDQKLFAFSKKIKEENKQKIAKIYYSNSAVEKNIIKRNVKNNNAKLLILGETLHKKTLEQKNNISLIKINLFKSLEQNDHILKKNLKILTKSISQKEKDIKNSKREYLLRQKGLFFHNKALSESIFQKLFSLRKTEIKRSVSYKKSKMNSLALLNNEKNILFAFLKNDLKKNSNRLKKELKMLERTKLTEAYTSKIENKLNYKKELKSLNSNQK